jgi:colicin import membrane protein
MSTDLAEVERTIAEISRVETGLAKLRADYFGVVYEVHLSEGLEAARAARRAIREPRFEVEKIRKAGKAPLLALGKMLDAEAARITRELVAIENPIDAQITAEETRREAEKQARIAAEMKRVEGIQARITEIRHIVTLAANASSARVREFAQSLGKTRIDESFEEFQDAAAVAVGAAREGLAQLLEAALAREAEAERIKAERAELATLKAEQEARAALEREAKALADAAELAQRQADRAEQDRAAAKVREEQRLEAERLAKERAELEALKRAQDAKDAAVKAEAERLAALKLLKKRSVKIPARGELIGCVATHWQVPVSVAEAWLEKTFAREVVA